MKYASFPMYDLPGLEHSWDAWWAIINRQFERAGIDGFMRDRLRLEQLQDHWSHPEMALSQTCGYPFVNGLSDTWQLLVTPCYDTPWCEGPRYRNLVLTSADSRFDSLESLRGSRVAFNSDHSHSGYNSIRSMIAPLAIDGRFFGAGVETGGHIQTMKSLLADDADCGSVDCVTYALAMKAGVIPETGLRIVAEGPAVPGLPIVVRRDVSADMIVSFRQAFRWAMDDPEFHAINDRLLVKGLEVIGEDQYQEIARMEQRAVAAGYAVLA